MITLKIKKITKKNHFLLKRFIVDRETRHFIFLKDMRLYRAARIAYINNFYKDHADNERIRRL